MKTLVSALMLQFVVFALVGCCAVSMPEAKATVKVVDEAGKPVQDAKVVIGFQYNESMKPGQGWGNNTIMNHAVGKSNADGIFEGAGVTDADVWAEAEKNGYYLTNSNSIAKPVRNTILNRWEPWPLKLEIVLKKMRNPVPMYRKSQDALKPAVFKQPVGYDLEVGDWVVPYGKGKSSDLFYTFQLQTIDEKEHYSCTITFPGQHDGLMEYKHPQDDHSWYKWPFEAPEDGYVNKFSGEAVYKVNMKSNTVKKEIKYLFRVRTKTDAEGKVISACYGKIEGMELNWEGLWFSYWFNPDGTRNLEEDPKKNLFDQVKKAK